jgi:hypothetical protein
LLAGNAEAFAVAGTAEPDLPAVFRLAPQQFD